MAISRRGFLHISGAAAAGAVLGSDLLDLFEVQAYAQPLKIKFAQEVTTICPFCAVGCGQIAHVKDGKVINIEGDPDHPINNGGSCSKGTGCLGMVDNERRLNKVLYRAPAGDRWESKSWDWALDKIARQIKDTRDKTFQEKNAKGNLVNRTEALALLGSACITNEECYAWVKAARSMGLVYMEHQARI